MTIGFARQVDDQDVHAMLAVNGQLLHRIVVNDEVHSEDCQEILEICDAVLAIDLALDRHNCQSMIAPRSDTVH